MSKWYDKSGMNDDVVIASRVRLARNTTEYPFSAKISEEDGRELIDNAISHMKDSEYAEIMNYIKMNEIKDTKKNSLLESHMINRYMAGRSDGAAVVSNDESISVMLNCEDHIRIQTMISGMAMDTCHKAADILDDYMENRFSYAYSEKYGYHTTFPTNIGTGMRASYILHLPALANTNKLQLLMNELGRFGVKMRPCYGDGVNGMGDIYRISNQRTLGQSEKDIIRNLDNVTMQLVEHERKQRMEFVEKNRIMAEDEAYKSYGVLKYSRTLSLKNAMMLLSEIRMGLSCGTIKFGNNSDFSVYGMMLAIQPRTIQYNAGGEKSMSVEAVDVERAKIIRNALPEIE